MDAQAIIRACTSVTKKWTKQRKAEERAASREDRRYEALAGSDRVTIKEVAEEVMEEAYMKASSGGTLPALARQIMYAARGEILKQTDRSTLDDQYFIQTLLVDYLNEHPDKAAKWDVVFDARGHFVEPHAGETVPLGTIDVRDYLHGIGQLPEEGIDLRLPNAGRYPTKGPKNRYGDILFIEKEGFMPLFEKVKLAERYDLAIMSTKGMSVTASRHLIDKLTGQHEIRVFVLHDFDKSGFSILGTLKHDTRRYEFENKVNVIDLGIRLDDVNRYKLESENVHYGKSDPRPKLREHGATEAECKFLCEGWDSGYHGRRVELNAFTSGDLIEWIEGKLKKHGVRKFVPAQEVLEAAYRRALEINLLEGKLEEVREEIRDQVMEVRIPRGLSARVKAHLKDDPSLSWDQAVNREVDPEAVEEDEDESGSAP